MGKLSDWIKANSKDGADISEAEALIQASTVEAIDSKEKALDFMKKNESFTKALDFYTSEAIRNHDVKFQSDKLPGLIEAEREKIKNELNPPKTEAEKKLAEMEKTLAGMKQKETQHEMEKTLRGKAKELGYPEDRVDRFTAYGENAISMLEEEAGYIKSQVNGMLEAEIKKRYGDTPAPRQSTGDPSKQITRSDYDNLSPNEQSTFVTGGGNVVDN